MYPSDLSDSEWEKIEPLFMVNYSKGGRPPKYTKREILNAIFYIAKTGCQWRFLPKDYPPWKRVYNYFRKWRQQELFERLNHRLRKAVRVLAERDEDPSAGIVDSQSVKVAERGPSGFDNGKKNQRT
jgi:putative transposase